MGDRAPLQQRDLLPGRIEPLVGEVQTGAQCDDEQGQSERCRKGRIAAHPAGGALAAAERSGRLKVKLKSEVQAIEPKTIALREDGVVRTVRNDSVIISAGGILPSEFLRSVGIEIDTKYGTA